MTMPFMFRAPAAPTALELPPLSQGLFGKATPHTAPPDSSSIRDGLVTAAARKHGIPVSLALAVARVENTRGLPKARGSAGEVGLMQIMPGPHKLTPTQLEDPAFNADFGVRLLAGLYAKHGSWNKALRAYNGALNNDTAGNQYVNRIRTELRRAHAQTQR